MLSSKMTGEVVKHVYLTLLLGVASIIIKDTCALKEMRIAVPEAALSGDTVTLSCEYNLEEVALYSIRWYWNDEEFYRYVPKESPPFRAFTVTFADFNVDIIRSGSTQVTLKNISREMTGDYKCEVSADAPLFHTDIKSAHMLVVDPPVTNPQLKIEEPLESTIKIEIGKTIRAACYAPWGSGNYLQPNITWFVNDQQVNTDLLPTAILPTKVEFNETTQQKFTKSTLEIQTKKSHFAGGLLKIRCQESIYKIWKKNVEKYFKEDIPQSAPVLGSTSSQSQTDEVVEILANSSCKHTKSLYLVLVMLLLCLR